MVFRRWLIIVSMAIEHVQVTFRISWYYLVIQRGTIMAPDISIITIPNFIKESMMVYHRKFLRMS